MRKISFVLLFIALMCISGCGSESPTPEDSHSASGDMASSEERNDTEEIFKTESSEQSAVQTEAAEADESTTYAPEKNETVSSEQTAEESKNNQTKKPTSHVSENSTSDTRPVETKPVEPEQSEPAETTPSESETSEPQPSDPPDPPVTETQPEQSFSKADHDRIIAEVVAYAESYKAKGYTFIWLDSMEFSWEVGYMGTPRIARDGVDGVIRSLKYHIDLIVKTTTDPANGITCDEMTYKVMQIDLDGEIAFVVVYGG